MNQATHTHTPGTTPPPFGEPHGDAVELRCELGRELAPEAERRQRARLAEEARLLESLAHPGVPRVVSVDLKPRDDGQRLPSVTLRLLRGVQLSEILAALHGERTRGGMGLAGGEPWSFTGALKVYVRLVETVAYAHDHDVVHRGIDPQRVVIGRCGEVQLNAWHLARDLRREDRHDLRLDGQGPAERLLTRDGDDLGAAPYVAPELLRSEQYHVGKSADVYALGAILYHLLAGHAPHARPGEAPSTHELARRAATGPPPSVRRLARRTPRALTRVVERALSPQRHRRPADARELLRAIEAALAHGFTTTGPLTGLALWAREHHLTAAVLLLGAGFLFVRGLQEEVPERGRVVGAAHRIDAGTRSTTTKADAAPATPPVAPVVAERAELAVEPVRDELHAAAPAEVAPPVAEADVEADAEADAAPAAATETATQIVVAAPAVEALEESAASVDEAAVETPEVEREEPAAPTSELAASTPAPAASELTSQPLGALLRRAVQARAEGDWEAAAQGFDELYRAHAAELGAGHVLTIRARRELAACLVESEEREAALIHYHGCLALHGEVDALALELQREYATLLLAMGERADGEQRLEAAAALAETLYGSGSALVASLYDQVAASAFRFGELDRVATAFERGLTARLAAAGALEPSEQSDVLAQRSTLVLLYQRLERPDAALLHARALLAATSEKHSAHAARAALVASLEAKIADE